MPIKTLVRSGPVLMLSLGACTNNVIVGDQAFGSGTGLGDGSTAAPSAQTSETGIASGGLDDSGGPVLDVAPNETGGPADACSIIPDPDGLDAPPPCVETAPPDSFTPAVQWTWTPDDSWTSSVVTPLVINLTDDDDNGVVDLCDIPDIVVVTYDPEVGWPAGGGNFNAGRISVLDGATGTLHYQTDYPISHVSNPAVGDIDGDGSAEIVTLSQTEVVAFEADGTVSWTAPRPELNGGIQLAVALADLDNDGTVEIIAGEAIHAGSDGALLRILPRTAAIPIPVDLDGDGDLEIVENYSAWHHDGTMYWDHPDGQNWMTFTAVADFDGDGRPEVVGMENGNTAPSYVFEHDGTVASVGGNLRSPPAVMDIDADGMVEIASADDSLYRLVDGTLQPIWEVPVSDGSGAASGTAFDFLGDAGAEAIYADEDELFIVDDQGNVVLQNPRSSWTQTEYPVVADVDNDASAEIVVVSNVGYHGMTSPTVQVIRDEQDRWVASRRIWNQHAYHITNVREDGSIPQFETPHWETFNTFRVNSQVLGKGGVDCIPPVP
ncbi:MAG: VCBS repeat-containing protein [Myxococcota bacterium]